MQINFELTDLYYLLAGFIFSGVIFSFYISKLKKEIKNIKRQYEKKSIGMDDSSLKVKTLENKIKTLETALKKQLENND
jgi:cell division protein FtsL